MGQGDKAGFLKVKRVSDAGYERVTRFTVPDSAVFDDADEVDLSLVGGAWVELAVSAYADMAAAVTAIGATPATLVIDSAETVSTAVTIPATLFLRIAKGAKLTKSGSGTITFQGLGLDNPDHKQPIFSGFAAGDVTWTGAVYPHELSSEWWDTANTSLTDRLNRADKAVEDRPAKIVAYPRTISGTAIISTHHWLYFTDGDYPSTLATWGVTHWPAFLIKSYTTVSGSQGARIYESAVESNGYLIYAWHIRNGGGESGGMQTDMIVEDLHVIGDEDQVELSGGSSCIQLGNCHNSVIRNCTFERTHAYTTTLGAFNTAGNYAFNSEIVGNKYIGIGTQIAVLLNCKSCRIADNYFDQHDSVGTSSYAAIDIEPNAEDDEMSDIVIENNIIDGRDVTDASKFSGGIAIQAAQDGSIKNLTVRHNKIYGADIYPAPTDFLPLASGIIAYGVLEGQIYDNYVRGAFQRAYTINQSRNLRIYDNHSMQSSDVTGDNGAMILTGVADSDVYHNVFNESPNAVRQSTGILEGETYHTVTTSGSTITNILNIGLLFRFYDLYKGLTVTVNNADYVVSAFTSQLSLTTSTSIGTLAQKTFVDANVTTGTENIAITAHGHNTGSAVWLTTSGAVPAGLSAGRTYFVIRVDADNLKLADTLALALAGTPINITAASGGGTHTLTPVLITKFSNSTYRDNKADDGITLVPGSDQNRVISTYRTRLSDYVPEDNSIGLEKLQSISTNAVLGAVTETPIDPVTWQNMVGVTQSGADNKLTKTAASGWGTGGASSVETFPANGNLQFTCTESGTDRMCGLSDVDTNQHYNTIDFAIQTDASLNIAVYESGSSIGSFGTATANTTKFKIERVGTTVTYYKDVTGVGGWTSMHTSGVSSSGALRADTAIDTTGGTVGGVKLGGPFGNVEALDRADVQSIVGILSATATLNFDLTTNVSQDLTITVTGAAVGDSVMLGIPNGSITADTVYTGWVSAADTVTIRAARLAGTPDPASGTFRATVIKI